MTAFGATQPHDYGKLPLTFESNIGQTDGRVKYLSRGAGYTLFLTAENEAVLSLARTTTTGERQTASVRMSMAGANRATSIQASDPQITRSNYINGNDPQKWITGVQHFGRVTYQSVYPGIDVVYYGNQRQLEYDFVVAPGANPASIRLKFQGADRLIVDSNGDLILQTQHGELRQLKPVVYQDVKGERKYIAGRYEVRHGEARFCLGRYDRSKVLVIDPILVYSTFLGGTGIENGYAATVDSAQQAYVAGSTTSSNFPIAGAIPGQSTPRGGGSDGYVAKFSAAGTAILFSTYIGGNGSDRVTGVALDSAGDILIAGATDSTDFPTRAALQNVIGGKTDAFAAKITGSGTSIGSLVFSTFIGGFEDDEVFGIVADKDKNAVLCGVTRSTNFWASGGLRSAFSGGVTDGWVFKLNSDGSRAWSTYLGGSGSDSTTGVAVDANADIYVTGATTSINFPSTAGAFQPVIAHPSATDAYVTKINAAGTQFLYSTYLGGTSYDEGLDIAVNAANEAYIVGDTDSVNFPVKNTLQGPPGNRDVFVTKLDATGSALVWSTYLAGSGIDNAADIALDTAGNAYVLGTTTSTNFPVVTPIQPTLTGGNDLFIAKIDAAGTARMWATYLGGSSDDVGSGIAVDSSGNVYIAGSAISGNFPTLTPAQGAGGGQDSFLTKIAGCDVIINPTSASIGVGGASSAFTVTANNCPWTATSTVPWITVTGGASGLNTAVVTFTVQANTSIARQGTISVSGVPFVVNQGGLSTVPPTAISLSPNAGSGLSQIFTARASTLNPGGPPIDRVYVLFNTIISGPGSCLIEFNPALNTFRVMNNDGNGFGAAVVAGTQTSVSNNQCTLNAAGSSGSTVAGTGTLITTVNYSITFNPSYAGLKNSYLLASSEATGLNSSWVQMGSWTVSTNGGGGGQQSVVSLSPLNGSNFSSTFTATFGHSGGLTQHYLGYLLLLPTPNVVNYTATGTCLIEHNRISNGMRLIDNAGTGWIGPLTGVPVGTPSATLSNNYCTVSVQDTIITTAGNNLTMSVPVTFQTTMGPVLGSFLQGFDVNGLFTGMTQFGNWTLPGAPQVRLGPQIASITPLAAVGTSATFTLSAIHTAGVGALARLHLLVGDRIVSETPCHIVYFPGSNTLNLVNDNGSGLVSANGITPGTGAGLANSRCVVNTAASSVTTGLSMNVTVPVAFSTATFGGSKSVYGLAFDGAGLTSHWVQGATLLVQ